MTNRSLEITTPTDREIVIRRRFNAPRHLVFDEWTRPALLQQWLLDLPGWTMPVCEADLRVGGALRFVWRGPDGGVMEMRGVYREVVPPRRFVHSQAFSGPWLSGETLVTTTFEERVGTTWMTISLRYASKQARDEALQSDMATGMSASYERLETLVTTTLLN